MQAPLETFPTLEASSLDGGFPASTRASTRSRLVRLRRRGRMAALVAALGILASVSASAPAFATGGVQGVRAEAPRLEEKSGYDTQYIFALSRAVANSTMVTGVKPPIMLFTIPADIVLLPVELIAGFF
jgi:inosine/xanthosine triphosphate pyrophosphatase family protein